VPTTSTCPGTCNRRWRDAEQRRELHGDPNPYTPVAGEPAWCLTCTSRLRTAISDMPRYAALLAVEAVHASPSPGVHVTGSKEQPLHPGDGAYRLLDEIHDALAFWEDAWCGLAGFRTRPAGRQGAVIARAARFLAAQLDRILIDGRIAEELDENIRTLKRQTEHVLHYQDVRPTPRDGVPCRECDHMTLEHQVDGHGRATGDTVCACCLTVYSEDELQAWIRMCAAYTQQQGAAA